MITYDSSETRDIPMCRLMNYGSTYLLKKVVLTKFISVCVPKGITGSVKGPKDPYLHSLTSTSTLHEWNPFHRTLMLKRPYNIWTILYIYKKTVTMWLLYSLYRRGWCWFIASGQEFYFNDVQ